MIKMNKNDRINLLEKFIWCVLLAVWAMSYLLPGRDRIYDLPCSQLLRGNWDVSALVLSSIFICVNGRDSHAKNREAKDAIIPLSIFT